MTVPSARWLLAPAAALSILAACGGVASQPQSQPSDTGPVTLRLGLYANLTHASALVGLHQGLFAQKLGSNVTLKTSIFNAGPDAVTALLSNSIDASYIGPNPTINAWAQSHGQAIRVISGATSGGAALVVKPSITSVADLKGKTLATPQLGNTQDVALRYWLSQKGLRTTTEGGGDVSIHPQDNATTLQTFRTGQIDGAWVPEPWASRLVIDGGGKVLVDERDLWPGGKFATTVIVVRTDFLRQHPTTVRHLLDGEVAADAFLNTQPAAAQQAAVDQIASISGSRLSNAVVAQAWTRMTFTDDPAAGSLNTEAKHAEQVGLLPNVDLKGIFDLKQLNQALAAAGKPAVPST